VSTVERAATALEGALATVPGLRVYTDPAAVVDPPAAVIGPPQLTWEAYSSDPTSARFVVFVVVAQDERSMPRLWELVPQVVATVETLVDAVIRSPVNPGAWTSGGTALPCYQIPIEVSLS
jgi:hypothetical protein